MYYYCVYNNVGMIQWSFAVKNFATSRIQTRALLTCFFFFIFKIWAYPSLFSGLFIAELFTTSIATDVQRSLDISAKCLQGMTIKNSRNF